jgi:hypothetical protein
MVGCFQGHDEIAESKSDRRIVVEMGMYSLKV